MTKQELFERIKGKVIVSCQAVPGEPLYVEEKSIMYLMARAAKQAGTPMIRTSSIRDVVAIKEETGLPVIGLIKVQHGSEARGWKEHQRVHQGSPRKISGRCPDGGHFHLRGGCECLEAWHGSRGNNDERLHRALCKA